MKFKLLFIMFIIILLGVSACLIPTTQAVEPGWSITINPNFIFIGNDVNFKIRGIPDFYFMLRISFNDTILRDSILDTNSLGVCYFNYTVPFEATPGTYSVSLHTLDGLNITKVNFEVIYDEVLLLRYRLNNALTDIENLKDQSRINYNIAKISYDNAKTNREIAYLSVIITVTTVLYMVLTRKKYWKTIAINNSNRKGFFQSTINFIDPPMKGLLVPFYNQYRAGLAKEFSLKRDIYNEELKLEPLLLYPDEDNPEKYTILQAKFVNKPNIKDEPLDEENEEGDEQ